MGPFPMSFGYSTSWWVDYVSKWVEVVPCKHNDHRVVLKFLKENIFSRFGVPKAIISDEGTHFCNKPFETLLAKYGVKHKNNLQDHSRDVSLSPSLWQSMPSPCELEYKAWWAIKKLNMDLAELAPHLSGKLKSRWIGPFYHSPSAFKWSSGTTQLQHTGSFKVNGHRLKPFVEPFSRDKEEFILLDPHQA
ncbi:hypothetical protein CK203_096526 [Vitis vinifera]|uniref:Integrase catalytic domain-containing protein n=1 Tax=Vitis vinifera TaxID=29760 RepID=A0A438CTZ5_VITVI|nr:hypothetical protein CK203_096526 [Vitis vinifera]